MGWMSLSLRVRVLSIIAILLALTLIAVASWRHAKAEAVHRDATALIAPAYRFPAG